MEKRENGLDVRSMGNLRIKPFYLYTHPLANFGGLFTERFIYSYTYNYTHEVS